MQTTLQDIRFAFRQFLRAPGFAVTVIVTLALGIGSATAVFSVIDATLLRPLPFAHQQRLVAPHTQAINGWNQPWSYPSYRDARAQLKTFDALAGYNLAGRINLEAPSGAVALAGVKTADNFFDVFGIKPLLGRTYLPGEDQPGKDDVAVLSYEVWQRDFGGQRDAVGKVVRLDGSPYTVIGVMPSGFRFPLEAVNAIYTPLHMTAQETTNRGSHWMFTVGLLQAGASEEQAQADLSHVFANLAKTYPDTDAGRTVKLVPLQKSENAGTDKPLEVLAFAVLSLLAIACVNVAGLLLARGVKREREMALRAAVGAGRFRIVRQVVTESLVYSVAGLALGVLLAYLMLAAMRTFLVEALARGVDVQLNLAALAVAMVLAGATSVLASLVPALRLAGTDPNRALRAGGATGTSRAQRRLRSSFVITQVAISVVLLIVSGVLLRNLRAKLTTDLGYNPRQILTVPINLSVGNYTGRDPYSTFYQPLIERIQAMHGVKAAGMINILPLQRWGFNSSVHITGQPAYPRNEDRWVELRFVTPGYFDAFGIKLERGRMLSSALDPWQNPAGSVIVNEAFRSMFFGNSGDPVGARMDDSDKAEEKTGIAGMVSDLRQHLTEPPMPEMDYLAEEIPPKDRAEYFASMTLVIRTDGDPQQLIAPIRSAMHQLDPTVPFTEPATMTQVTASSLVFERMENWLFGIFAGLALLLALVGIYGLISHEVELRTRDIGVRMALGSSRARVVREILIRVAALMTIGLTAGMALTFLMRPVLASVIVLGKGRDSWLLAFLTLGLGIAGVGASLIPASRAASINPIEALRTE
jgi:putative ABC transport system permease protein